MDALSNCINEYRIFFIIALLILSVLVFMSASLRGNVKKLAIGLFVMVALGMTYSHVTGKSALDIPAEINSFFNTPSTQVEPSHRYYRDPDERYK